MGGVSSPPAPMGSLGNTRDSASRVLSISELGRPQPVSVPVADVVSCMCCMCVLEDPDDIETGSLPAPAMTSPSMGGMGDRSANGSIPSELIDLDDVPQVVVHEGEGVDEATGM